MVEKVLNGDDNIDTSKRKAPSTQHVEATKMSTNKTIELNYVQNKLENFKSIILDDVERRMNIMIDEIMQEIRQHELQTHEFQSFAKTNLLQHSTSTWNNRRLENELNLKEISDIQDDFNKNKKVDDDDDRKNGNNLTKRPLHKQYKPLPDKEFVQRESYLTVLLNIPHMKSIYHIFYIIVLVFLLNSICHDYFVDGKISFGLGTFKIGLNKIHLVFGILFLENLVVILLYYALKIWGVVRTKLVVKKNLKRFWSHSCLISYICLQLVFSYVGSASCIKLQLPFVTASVLLLETTRLQMKMHAFVRANVPRQLADKLKIDDCSKHTAPVMPPIGSYIYFLFAPTLIYRDNYPRTTHIRWKFALNRFLEVVAVAFLYSYIHERHIVVHFGNFGIESLSASSVLVKLFGMTTPSIVIFLSGFYLILHSWLNFTSELLRFGDRMFYKDWWTSVNYDSYFRNWNVVVHDWLYEYIYKDCCNYLFKGSKMAGSMMVFTVSALVHEYILGFALQVFFPVMFVFFGIVGVACVFLTRKLSKSLGNLFIWGSLMFGNTLMICLYCMEYYAQQNKPKPLNTWLDHITPAIWHCYKS